MNRTSAICYFLTALITAFIFWVEYSYHHHGLWERLYKRKFIKLLHVYTMRILIYGTILYIFISVIRFLFLLGGGDGAKE